MNEGQIPDFEVLPIQQMLHQHCVEHQQAYLCVLGDLHGHLCVMSNVPPEEPALLRFLEMVIEHLRSEGLSPRDLAPKRH